LIAFLATIREIISPQNMGSLLINKMILKMSEMVVSLMGILEGTTLKKAKATDFYSLCS